VALLSTAALLVRRRAPLRAPALACLAVLVTVLVMGPSPRFGLAAFLAPPALLLATRGAALVALAAAYAAILQMLGDRVALGAVVLGALAVAVLFTRRRLVAAVVTILALDAAALHARAYQTGRYRPALVSPPPIRADVATRAERANDLVFTRPVEGDRCWASPQPCAPWDLRHDVRLARPELGVRGGLVKR
jgi:hypothetical protein